MPTVFIISNKVKFIGYSFLAIFSITLQLGCKKYLDKKPMQSQVIPSTLNDLQAILDNNNVMNQQSTPALLEIIADDYYVTTATWQSRPVDERLNYIWDQNATYYDCWRRPYEGMIYYANVVLDQLPFIGHSDDDKDLFNAIKGSSLFYRSFGLYQIAQLYCKPYNEASASTDLGIVLKTSSNINDAIKRSSVKQTYDQIINDLKSAADLLPETTAFPTRPSKTAAYGTLARIFLCMRDYTNAGYYADLCLQKYNNLMDYNTTSVPFQRFNPEVIYYSWPQFLPIMAASRARIDSTLYQSYNSNDLRRTRFFKANTGANVGSFSFQGGYDGQSGVFIPTDGVATDEVYLIRAESYARAGNKDAAMTDLNTLMKKRWNNSNWVPFTATDANDALSKILNERRKELVFRGIRWSDVRRLNLEGANITLKRIINGITYSLPPNDPRSVLLVPQQIIKLGGMEQNPR